MCKAPAPTLQRGSLVSASCSRAAWHQQRRRSSRKANRASAATETPDHGAAATRCAVRRRSALIHCQRAAFPTRVSASSSGARCRGSAGERCRRSSARTNGAPVLAADSVSYGWTAGAYAQLLFTSCLQCACERMLCVQVHSARCLRECCNTVFQCGTRTTHLHGCRFYAVLDCAAIWYACVSLCSRHNSAWLTLEQAQSLQLLSYANKLRKSCRRSRVQRSWASPRNQRAHLNKPPSLSRFVRWMMKPTRP